MLNKYICVGILIGVIALAGCSVNGQSEGQAQVKEKTTEDKTNGQVVDVENSPDRVKGEVVLVVPLELTQQQKKEYYKQYEEIIKEVNSEYDKDLKLSPLEEFKSEEWVTTEDFEQIAIDMATMEFTTVVFGGDPVE